MSNEFKEWIKDKAVDILFDAGAIDKIEEILLTPQLVSCYVSGWKNGQEVYFFVWLNDEGEWVFEHRELKK
jgi:hypothetical protein